MNVEERLSRLEKGHDDIQADLKELTLQIKLLAQAMNKVPERLTDVERKQSNTDLIIKALTALSYMVAGTGILMIMTHIFERVS